VRSGRCAWDGPTGVRPTGRWRFTSILSLATTTALYDHVWDHASVAAAIRGVLKWRQKRRRGGVTFYFQ
jgi:hypothetical protein